MFKKIFLTTIAVGCLFLSVGVANAQINQALGKLNAVAGKSGLKSDLQTPMGNIIAAALALVGTIFLILTVYAGILWMTAAGNTERADKARSIITMAVIGLAITLGAYAITTFITGRLAAGGESANKGCCIVINGSETKCRPDMTATECSMVNGSLSPGVCMEDCATF